MSRKVYFLRKRLCLSNFDLNVGKLIDKLSAIKAVKMMVFAAKGGFYEGYFITNEAFNRNPYDPKDDEDFYAEYLIFS